MRDISLHPRRLFVHAGAHRTGTSSFQMFLGENRDRLMAAGYDVAFPNRDDQPGTGLGLRLPKPKHEGVRLRRFRMSVREEVARVNPDSAARALILSEENLMGRMLHFFQGEFYPAAEARIRVMAQALPPPEVLMLVIRDYAGLFASAYRKRAEDNLVTPFAQDAETMANMAEGWPKIVALFQHHWNPRRLVVIDYAARGTNAALLARLVPAAPSDLVPLPMRLNASASDAALMALQARYAAGETLTRDRWQAVIAAHADDRTDHGFARFTPAQARRLATRYEKDRARIASMPGLEIIG